MINHHPQYHAWPRGTTHRLRSPLITTHTVPRPTHDYSQRAFTLIATLSHTHTHTHTHTNTFRMQGHEKQTNKQTNKQTKKLIPRGWTGIGIHTHTRTTRLPTSNILCMVAHRNKKHSPPSCRSPKLRQSQQATKRPFHWTVCKSRAQVGRNGPANHAMKNKPRRFTRKRNKRPKSLSINYLPKAKE